jgi:hypothetical protein
MKPTSTWHTPHVSTSFLIIASCLVLFLSLYFKALKYTIKASEKKERAKDKKVGYMKRVIVGSLTVSI